MEEEKRMKPTRKGIAKATIVGLLALVMAIPAGMMVMADQSHPAQVVPDQALSNMVKLKYAVFDPMQGVPSVPAGLRAPDYRVTEIVPFIVQGYGPVTEDWKAELMNSGCNLISYIPDYGFLVTMTGEDRDNVASLASVRWVGAFEPAYKLDKSLVGAEGTRTINVMFFPGASNGHVVNLAKNYNAGRVIEVSANEVVNTVMMEIDASWLNTIACMPEVKWIEPYYLPKATNDQCSQLLQGGAVTGGRDIAAHGIYGQTMVACVADTGVRTTHQVWADAGKIVDNYVPPGSTGELGLTGSGTDEHGMATSGSVCGDRTPFNAYTGADGALCDGHAYGADLVFQDIDVADAAEAYVHPPADYYHDMYQIAEFGNNTGSTQPPMTQTGGATVHSNSWGGGAGSPYGADAVMIDQYVWDHNEFVICFAAGNDANARTIGIQAEAKNCIAVGSLNEAGTARSTFSSQGPRLPDGALKPDIATPGEGISTADGASDADFWNEAFSGTSAACPAAAGEAVLMQQYFKEGWYPKGAATPANGFMPSSALVKAAFFSGAVDTGTANAPNNQEGWGRPYVDNSLFFAADTLDAWMVDNKEGLLTGDYVDYQISVAGTTQRLKIMLDWADYPGDPTSSVMLVNDLDLMVTNPSATQYRGNNYAAGWSVATGTGNVDDNKNNTEGVSISAPPAGIWNIRITAQNIARGPQNFALYVTGDLTPGYGTVFMDRTVYGSPDQISIDVEDSNNAAGSVTVMLSTTSGDFENVTVPGTAANSGMYKGGTIPTAAAIIAKNDGTIQLVNGDTITASYIDASPSHTSYAYARADIRGPVITNVYADGIMDTAAIIHWTTNENADSTIYYGPTVALGSTKYDAAMAIKHKVIIKGLNSATTYYFDVASKDASGRSTRDSNGGTHYTFTTTSPTTGGAVVLLVDDDTNTKSERSGTPFERDWINNLNNYGWTYTHWDLAVYGTPTLTDMNSANILLWYVAEGYPQISSEDRPIIGSYLNQTLTPKGTRPMMWLAGQDIGWDMCDAAGTDRDPSWFQYNLAATFRRDDADGGAGTEVGNFQVMNVGHPLNIYGYNNVDLEVEAYDYPVGTPGRFWPDDITRRATGGSAEVWDYSNHAGGGDAGTVSQTAAGAPGQARVVYEAFAHDMIASTNTGANDYRPDLNQIDPERAGILDETIQWLLGGDHPDVDLTYPAGGESLTGSINIQWTVANANSINLYYSPNGGQQWNTIVTGLAGTTTSYTWDISGLLTGPSYQVKVVALRTVTFATLSDYDSSLNFTITGVDNLGPVVMAGSVTADKNPTMDGQGKTMWFNATVTDVGKGGSNINTAEYFIDTTGANGAGTAMTATDGSYNSPTEAVRWSGVEAWAAGTHTLFVHGRDAASNWGGYTNCTFILLGSGPQPQVWQNSTVNTTGWFLFSLSIRNTAGAPFNWLFTDEVGATRVTWDRVMWYNPATPTDPWKQYNKNWPTALNDLTSYTTSMGVWLNVTLTGDGIMHKGGTNWTNDASTPVAISAGWNLIGFPSDDAAYTVGTLKADCAVITTVQGLMPGATYRVTNNLANTQNMGWGRAYWVFATGAGTWTKTY
jgi:hypothetical protein